MRITLADFGKKCFCDELVNGDFFCINSEMEYFGWEHCPIYYLGVDGDSGQNYIIIFRGNSWVLDLSPGEIYDRDIFSEHYKNKELRKVISIRFSDR